MNRITNHINSFSVRIILSMIFICIISISGVSLYSYYYLDKAINEEIINYNRTQLNYLKESVENRIIQEAYIILFNILAENKMNSILFSYFRNNDEKLSKVPEIQSKLKEYVDLNGTTISSVIIYYKNDHLMISSNSGVKFLDSESFQLPYDYGWLNAYISGEQSSGSKWLELREKPNFDPDKSNGRVLSLVGTLPYGSKFEDSKGLVALNIDDIIIGNVLNDSVGANSEYVSIINNSGEFIYKSENFYDEIYKKSDFSNNNWDESGKIINVEGNDIIFIYHKSDYNDWYYVYTIPVDIFYNKKVPLKKIFLITLGMIFVILLVVTFLVSKKLTKPIKNLTEKVKGFFEIGENGKDNIYDIMLVNNTLDMLSKKTKILEERIDGNKTIVRNSFLINLLNGYFLNLDEINKRIKYLDIFFNKEYYFVLVVGANNSVIQNKNIIKDINRIKNQEFSSQAIEYNNKYIYVIVNCNSKTSMNIALIIDHINRIFIFHNIYDSQFALGNIENSLIDVKKSFDTAILCAKYFVFFPNMKTFDYTIVSIWDKNYYDFSNNMDKIFIKLTDLDILEFTNSINRIKIITISRPISFASYKMCIEDIIRTMNKFISCNSAEENILLINSNEFIDLNKSVEETFNNIISIGITIIEEASNFQKNDLNGDYVRRTINYIEEYYYKDISLQDIADSLHVTRNHICRVFKQTTSNTILNYLMNYRMNKAKEAVIISEKSIAEISQSVGFLNPGYFSKKFKQKFGITPQKYRENYSSSL